jgi:hypothetical protein
MKKVWEHFPIVDGAERYPVAAIPWIAKTMARIAIWKNLHEKL